MRYMTNSTKKHRMGWRPDLPDFRDYATTYPDVSNHVASVEKYQFDIIKIWNCIKRNDHQI